MAEERPLSDIELDAALREALAVETSPDFIVRVRRRVADEPAAGAPARLFAIAAPIAVAGIVSVVVLLHRTAVPEQSTARMTTATERSRATLPAPPVVAAVRAHRVVAVPTRHRNRGRDDFHKMPSGDVLIPAAEQQALRRLFERPPAAVLNLAARRSDDPMEVAAIVIPPLRINPLLPESEEGGHQ